MSHGDHNNPGHGDGGDGTCDMIMILHAGHCETILFKTWVANTPGLFAVSTIGIFAVAVIYEGLKFWRQQLYAGYSNECEKKGEKTIKQQMLNKMHVLQTFIHLIQAVLSYALMLIVMTYNAYLIVAVVLGAAVGYFLFGWMRQKSVDVTEYCH